MNASIYEELKRVAERREVTSYSAIAPMVDLDMNRADDRRQIGVLLDEISTHEHEQERPMLSAVVTHKDGDPGKGFYTLARELGVMARKTSPLAFWSQELRRVHDYWSTRTP